MNYYDRHIGDILKETIGLSMLEDGAYGRLLDQVYSTERPLPADKREVYRDARATSTAERKAVDYVLAKFFVLTAEGYVHERAQAQIEEYWDREPAEQNKRENAKIRQQRARERRKQLFEELRNHGVTPEFNASTKQLEAELSRVTKRDENAGSHKPVTRDDTATQSPIPIPQSPDLKPETSLVASNVVGDEKLQDETIPPERSTQIAVLLRAKQVKPFTFAHPLAHEWAADPRVTDAILNAAVQQARDYKPTGDISPNYLKPIIEQLINPPPERPRKPHEDWSWKKSDAGIDAKGRELGMNARGGESYRDYAARIESEIEKRSREGARA